MSENIASFVAMDEGETPCRPKPSHKRRSTLYRRRSTLQAQSESTSQNLCDESKADARKMERIENLEPIDVENNRNKELPFDIKKYIHDLKEERKMWKETFVNRKRQRKSISKQISNMKRCEEDLDLSLLSESDRNFLLVQPNYEHIYEKAKKLSIMAGETLIMNEHVMHLQKRCMLRAEKKLDDLTMRIIKLVD